MPLEFQKINGFDRGLLYQQLLDAYSFDRRWREHFDADWKEYDRFFFDHPEIADTCGFFTILEGRPIGHITWDPRRAPEYVEIGHNCVETAYKGQGYGKVQLQEALRRISQNGGIRQIRVTTSVSLLPAQHNYESVGFRLCRRRENRDDAFSGDYLDYAMTLCREKPARG